MSALLIITGLYIVETIIITKCFKNMEKLDGIFLLNLFVVLGLLILRVK